MLIGTTRSRKRRKAPEGSDLFAWIPRLGPAFQVAPLVLRMLAPVCSPIPHPFGDSAEAVPESSAVRRRRHFMGKS